MNPNAMTKTNMAPIIDAAMCESCESSAGTGAAYDQMEIEKVSQPVWYEWNPNIDVLAECNAEESPYIQGPKINSTGSCSFITKLVGKDRPVEIKHLLAKMVSGDRELLEWLRNEIYHLDLIQRRCHSPFLVDFRGVYRWDKSPPDNEDVLGIVMTKALGDLHSFVWGHRENHRNVPEVHVWNMLVQMARALVLIHEGEAPFANPPFVNGSVFAEGEKEWRPIVHRDIKTPNILVCHVGRELPLLKLADFGGAMSEKHATDEEKAAGRAKAAARKARKEKEAAEKAAKEGFEPPQSCSNCNNDWTWHAGHEMELEAVYDLGEVQHVRAPVNPQTVEGAVAFQPLQEVVMPQPLGGGIVMPPVLSGYYPPDNAPFRRSHDEFSAALLSPWTNSQKQVGHAALNAAKDVVMDGCDADAMEVNTGSGLGSYCPPLASHMFGARTKGVETMSYSDMKSNGGKTITVRYDRNPRFEPNHAHRSDDAPPADWLNANSVHQPTRDKGKGPAEPAPKPAKLDLKGNAIKAEHVFIGIRPPEYPDVLPAGDIYALGLTATEMCAFEYRRLCPCRIYELQLTPSQRTTFPLYHPAIAWWTAPYSPALCRLMRYMTCENPALRPTASELLVLAEKCLRNFRDHQSTTKDERAAINELLGIEEGEAEGEAAGEAEGGAKGERNEGNGDGETDDEDEKAENSWVRERPWNRKR
jgi:serine/threonine protein kinase